MSSLKPMHVTFRTEGRAVSVWHDRVDVAVNYDHPDGIGRQFMLLPMAIARDVAIAILMAAQEIDTKR